MVSNIAIFLIIITLFISFVLPIVALVVYAVKNKGKKIVSAWLLGAAGFFVMQIIIRTPILKLISALPGFMDFVTNHYVLYVLALGITAALFEVVGRFVVAKIMSKQNQLTFERSVAAGLGHGGIESMLLVGLTYINNLVYVVMINSNTYDSMVETTAAAGVDVTSLWQMKETFLTTSPAIFGLAGLERLLTMICQLAMTLVVCYFVSNTANKGHTFKGVLTVFVFHALLDTVSGLINGMSTQYMGSIISQNVAYIILYIFLGIMTAIAVRITIKVKSKYTI